MKNSDIVNLLKLRFAVYKAGCGKGLWPCLEDNAAKEYMYYLFPKSSKLAFYNLMINIVQKTHENFSCCSYCLLVGISNSRMSASNNLATSARVSIDGCDVLVHHLLIVAGSLPILSANHLAVFFFSTRTTFSLFNSAIMIN